IRRTATQRLVSASEVRRFEGERHGRRQPPARHFREDHAYGILQPPLTDVTTGGHVGAGPHEFGGLEREHRACPAPIAAAHLTELVLVRREKHRVRRPGVLRRYLIQRRQENVTHAQQLDWFDRTPGQAPPKSVPVAEIYRCR